MKNETAWQEKLAEWLYRKIGGQDGGLSWGALPHAERRRYRDLVTEFEEEQGLVEEHERDMQDLERDLTDEHSDEIEQAEERARGFAEDAKGFEEDLDKERDAHQETIDKLEETRCQLRDAQSQLLKARESAGLSDDDLEKARSAAYKRGYRAGKKKAEATEDGE